MLTVWLPFSVGTTLDSLGLYLKLWTLFLDPGFCEFKGLNPLSSKIQGLYHSILQRFVKHIGLWISYSFFTNTEQKSRRLLVGWIFFIKIPKLIIFFFFFFITISNLDLAYWFLSKNPRFPFAIQIRWKKVLVSWVDRFFYQDLLKFTIRKSFMFHCP